MTSGTAVVCAGVSTRRERPAYFDERLSGLLDLVELVQADLAQLQRAVERLVFETPDQAPKQ